MYGEFGVGKTTLAATAVYVPQMRDVIMVNAEAGDLSLTTANFPEIDTIRCPDYRTVGRAQDFLRQHCILRDKKDIESLRKMESFMKGIPEEEILEPKQYRTVIVDSLAEVEANSMYQLLGVRPDTAIDVELAVAEWPEFRKNYQQIMRLVRAFRDLPMNILMTCPSMYAQDASKKMLYTPALTGRLAKMVQGIFDVVGYYAMGAPNPAEPTKERRLLYVQPGSQWNAKCRFANYKAPYFENPTMETILKAVGLLEAPQQPTK